MTRPRSDRHEGKVALVVGAGSRGGIGYSCAVRLAVLGADVAIADLPSTTVKALATELPGAGSHSAHAVDITDPESVESLIEEVRAAHERIDSLISTAGILEMERFLEISVDSWERSFAVNATGVFLLCQAVARRMIRQESGGRMVVVASNAGRLPRLATGAYGASKAAVIQLVRSMALELAEHGITVNALCPGSTATSMMIDGQARGDPKRLEEVVQGSLKQWRTGIPLGRLAEPSEQAAVAAFLVSDGGRHITGQALCVDGGQTFF